MPESIKVSTSKVNDPQTPDVTAIFEYEIPATLEEAQKRFPAVMHGGALVDPVYAMWRKGFVIVIQAPARQETARQWESLPAEQRSALMTRHEKDGVVSYTAVLPEAQCALLQKHMDAWKLGERAPRVRVEYAGDPVAAFLAAAKNMTDEQREEVAIQVAAMLGMPKPRPRK